MTALRIVSFVEGRTLTGPIQPLLSFARRIAGAGLLPGVQQTIVTTIRHGARSPASNDFIDSARAQGTEVDIVTERHPLDTAIVSKVLAILDMRNPHIVETHSFKPHFVLSLIRRQLKHAEELRWIAFHHGYTAESLKVRFYNQFDRWSLRRADRVITLCKPFAEELQRSRGVNLERICVIRNAVEAKSPASEIQVAGLRADLGVATHERIILAVGRLSSEKGHADLIRAFASLMDKHPFAALRLVIVGDGVERRQLSRAARCLGKSVILAGHRNDIRPFYGAASIFVLPSHTEGSPLVLLEAMMAGLPVVATAVGGIPEIVTDGHSALLVPPHSPEALGAAIERLLLHRSVASTIALAAAGDLSRFSIDNYCNALLSIYKSTLARPAAHRLGEVPS